jgi:cation transport ATPase
MAMFDSIIFEFEKRFIEERAREDARVGLHMSDEVTTADIGSVPPLWDPKSNARHAAAESKLADSRVETAERELQREHDEASQQASPRMMLIVIVALYVLEVGAAYFLIGDMGFSAAIRWVLSMAFAIVLFAIVHRLSETRSRIAFFFTWACIITLAVAVTILRLQERDSGEGSFVVDFAAAVVVLPLTLGPAFVARNKMEQLARVLPRARRISRLRAHLLYMRTARRLSRWYRDRVIGRREQWEENARRRRAIYDRAHRIARAHAENGFGINEPSRDGRQLTLFPGEQRAPRGT